MVFIKVKPCSTRPAFPPAVAPLPPVALFFPLPVPLLPILALFSSSYFSPFSLFSSLFSSVAFVTAKESVKSARGAPKKP